MVDQLVETGVQFPGYVNLDSVAKRYGIDPRRHTGEEYLHLVAKVSLQGIMAFSSSFPPIIEFFSPRCSFRGFPRARDKKHEKKSTR